MKLIVNGKTAKVRSSKGLKPQIVVTVDSGATVKAINKDRILTTKSKNGLVILNIPRYGEWTVIATNGVTEKREAVSIHEAKQYSFGFKLVHIYGVEWDGTATTKWTRTDDSALFEDPIPAVANGTGSSPFDNLMPWSGMVKEIRAGGVMVKEPKYWFKWTADGKKLKLQIADGPVEGFYVDPVNMDREDGRGELDFSYIGRYHSVDTTWTSMSGVAPRVSINKSVAREHCRSIGDDYYMMDFAQFWYIAMLYLVEFADWNSQKVIGLGGNGRIANGTTDSMLYHTGTNAINRDTMGLTQYRNIEGLWDNCYDWLDGCYHLNGTKVGLYVILNPDLFDNVDNGYKVGTFGYTGNKYPMSMKIPKNPSFQWALYPYLSGGSDTSYIPDIWGRASDALSLYHGGYNTSEKFNGLFSMRSKQVSVGDTSISFRIQERPRKS